MMFQKDQRGFSLIEMIITMAIIAIVAGLSINLISHIHVTSTEKVVKTMTSAMTKIQVNAMRKSVAEKPYLYVYLVGDTYYYLASAADPSTISFDASAGTELGSGVKIYKNSISDGTLVTGTNYIRISYKKDGSFVDGADNCFFVKGAYTAKISLNQKTGKYFVENKDN